MSAEFAWAALPIIGVIFFAFCCVVAFVFVKNAIAPPHDKWTRLD